jgi:uncharacterized protein (TIGR02145 family)
MRRLHTIKAIAIIFILIVIMTVTAYGEQLCGDANGDETVNVSDAVYLINYVFLAGDPPDTLCIGDANLDYDVNVSDAVFIINYVFIFGSPAPNPYCCDACPPMVIDVDGNIYQTVLIGDQCWMMENLKVTHYRNGDSIPNVTDGGEWYGLSTGACCTYSNDEGEADVYGRLYNFYAIVDSRSVAPAGWHVPTDEEWKQLEIYLGMSQAATDAIGWRGTDEGGKLKETGTEHWNPPNTGATNESSFTALPGGYRVNTGGFLNMGTYAYFWSSTESDSYSTWGRLLSSGIAAIYRYADSKKAGFSIRCVKNQ